MNVHKTKTTKQVLKKLSKRDKRYCHRLFTTLIAEQKRQIDVGIKFNELYQDQINDSCILLARKTKKVTVTKHAKYRFAERFEWYGYTIEQIMVDLKTWWTFIHMLDDGRIKVKWMLGDYIIDKDTMTIITMFIPRDLEFNLLRKNNGT